MKKLIILMGLTGMVHFGAIAQDDRITRPVTNPATNPNVTGEDNQRNRPGNPSYINPDYDHSHSYYQLPYNDPHRHYLQIDENPAPVNNIDNNNTMTPYNNNMSPYDVTSPYYTPPNSNAPLNSTPPVR